MKTIIELERDDLVKLFSEKFKIAPMKVSVLSDNPVVRIDITGVEEKVLHGEDAKPKIGKIL